MDGVAQTSAVVSYTPAGAEHYFDDIVDGNHRLLLQRGESFGDKLYNALADLLAEGFESAAIMDADSPTLPRSYLVQAFSELSRPGDRVVLGPASDGGYYLIGIKRPHRPLFDRITWSTERVLEETLERAREIEIETVLLPEWYDVDSVAEFERLKREILDGSASGSHTESVASHTRDFIRLRFGDLRRAGPVMKENRS